MSTLDDRALARYRELHPSMADIPDERVKTTMAYAIVRVNVGVRELGGVTMAEMQQAARAWQRVGTPARELIRRWREGGKF